MKPEISFKIICMQQLKKYNTRASYICVRTRASIFSSSFMLLCCCYRLAKISNISTFISFYDKFIAAWWLFEAVRDLRTVERASSAYQTFQCSYRLLHMKSSVDTVWLFHYGIDCVGLYVTLIRRIWTEENYKFMTALISDQRLCFVHLRMIARISDNFLNYR